jgi:uncharacterized protein (DUF305 family)
MSRYLVLSALGAAITFGTAVYAHDGQMRHQMSEEMPAIGDSFEAQMGRAMERMDHDMMVPPSGNYDRDFAAMMVPHHQGAIDMARIELQYGKDPVLRRLAQAIIVEQLQEIEVMNLQLKQLPAATPQTSPHQADHH